jgi:hypothetical protein
MTSLPANLSDLLSPEAYPHAVRDLQLVETHMSWVLLTGDFAYKIKKPVCYSFVDLRSAERRSFYCTEELRLNRRFARNLYIEVCAVTAQNGAACMAGQGKVVEHAVRMRQFERAEELDCLLANAGVDPVELAAFGRDLAGIHGGLPVGEGSQTWGRPEVLRKVLLENLEQCLQGAALLNEGRLMRAVRRNFAARVADADPWLEMRWRDGRVRECHGDLHSRNIVRYDGRLIAFDCVEFDPAFRWIDVADDVAFLMMDLEARGFPLHAQAFRDAYLAESGDFAACRMLPLYQTHRALVRAKVTALEAAGAQAAERREAALESHREYLRHAGRTLASRQPRLLLMFGLSGSGKTWLARQLAPALDAVLIHSDVERKRLAGLPEQQRTRSELEQGIYSPASSARVYARLEECAGHALAGGYTVVVDAAFHRRDDRHSFHALAGRHGAHVQLIRCHASRKVLERRIRDRARAMTDASEADLAVLEWQEASLEPVLDNEGFDTVDTDTAAPDAVAGAIRVLSKKR